MSDKDENAKANGKRQARGVFERPAGSGLWWVRYTDENGRLHREHVGPKALAIKVYQKRKNGPFVAVAIHTGLRQSEQLKLNWENVDFTAGTITVPKSKHGKARHVPMNDTVRALLRDLGASDNVVEFPQEASAPGVIRTPDLQIRSLPL